MIFERTSEQQQQNNKQKLFKSEERHHPAAAESLQKKSTILFFFFSFFLSLHCSSGSLSSALPSLTRLPFFSLTRSKKRKQKRAGGFVKTLCAKKISFA